MSSSASIDKGNGSIVKITIPGTVYAMNLRNCIVLSDCHQLRVHNCQNTLFVSNVKTNVIIENCKELKFSGNLTIDDFDFGFGNSKSYQLVDYNDKKLSWITESYNFEKLQHYLKDANLINSSNINNREI